MAQLIVRNLDDGVKEKLKVQAKLHGRSLEAEVRAILSTVLSGPAADKDVPPGESLGEMMQARFAKGGLKEDELQIVNEAVAELRTELRLRLPDFDK